MRNKVLGRNWALGALVCVLGLAGSAAAQQEGHLGLPIDWSFRHVIHHNAVDSTFAQVSQQEPRILYNWMQSARARQQSTLPPPSGAARAPRNKPRTISHTDWHFTLGAGTVAANMSPAKFSFNVNATPDCANDYAIYGLNAAGSASQPNLVGFKNLYSGTSGSAVVISSATESGTTVTIVTAPSTYAVGNYVTVTGVVPAGYDGTFPITSTNGTTTFTYTDVSGLTSPANVGGPPPASAVVSGLCGTAPSVNWAYNVSTSGGVVQTSPSLSLDGTQVAFIESVIGGSSIFHVLKLGSATEGSFSSGTNTYTTATPGAGGSNASMVSLTYSASSNTRSSLFVDYANDAAYFGDDNGNLYKTTCVFNCIPFGFTLSASSVSVAPAGTVMSSPVVDLNTGKIFVGGSNGVLYMVPTSCFTGACTITSSTVGFNGTNGAVIDGVLLDNTFQTLFVTAGRNGGTATAPANVVQLNESMTKLATVAMSANAYNIPAGALDDEYYNNSIGSASVTGNGYFCGPGAGSGQAFIFTFSFSATGTLSSSNPPVMASSATLNVPGNHAEACNPLLTFTSGGAERLFFSQNGVPKAGCTGASAADGCLFDYTITTSTGAIALGTSTSEHGGTSAVVVDNVSTLPQAASLYFASLSTAAGSTSAPSCTTGTGGGTTAAFCAIKVTQSGLQ